MKDVEKYVDCVEIQVVIDNDDVMFIKIDGKQQSYISVQSHEREMIGFPFLLKIGPFYKSSFLAQR